MTCSPSADKLARPASAESSPASSELTTVSETRKSPKRLKAELCVGVRVRVKRCCSPIATARQKLCRRHELVEACRRRGCKTDTVEAEAVGAAPWCSTSASISRLGLDELFLSAEDSVPNSGALTLRGGQIVNIVAHAEELQSALHKFRSSMSDCFVAVDLEWKPNFTCGARNRVALMQLASSTCCLLIRLSHMGTEFPSQLLKFLRDPSYRFVCFAWACSDEAQMRRTYGLGCRNLFGNMLDLQDIAESLGYEKIGLARLIQRVLRAEMPKDKKLSMANWEMPRLTPMLVQYAVSDCILTGHVFRIFREWHAANATCTYCNQPLGMKLPAPTLKCDHCLKVFSTWLGLKNHCNALHVPPPCSNCVECGRLMTV